VLGRFEGFPVKKLETLRTAAALYSKLDAIVTELHSWKIVAPLGKLLDKVECYFTKVIRFSESHSFVMLSLLYSNESNS